MHPRPYPIPLQQSKAQDSIQSGGAGRVSPFRQTNVLSKVILAWVMTSISSVLALAFAHCDAR